MSAISCDLREARYSLEPTFFAAAETDAGPLEIRVQRGSNLVSISDGLAILVLDPVDVFRNQLGVPMELRAVFDHPVRMSLYLNDTCPASRTENPVNYEATSGTITFSNIYAPSEDDENAETAGVFENVRFEDPRDPTGRFALLSGDFRFLFSRGRPAQPFP